MSAAIPTDPSGGLDAAVVRDCAAIVACAEEEARICKLHSGKLRMPARTSAKLDESWSRLKAAVDRVVLAPAVGPAKLVATARAALAVRDVYVDGSGPVDGGPGARLAWTVCRAVVARAEAGERERAAGR